MSSKNLGLNLPPYQEFAASIASLALPLSPSELHGIMCGFLCADRGNTGENWIRALVGQHKTEAVRHAVLAIFELFSISEQAITAFDFSFSLLLPDDDSSIQERAEAFKDWCYGFSQGMILSEVRYDQLKDDESREALKHFQEFAELDIDSLDVSEDDEKALMEVTEYARMAVLRLHGDLASPDQEQEERDNTH